ncbi:MAG: pyrimidine dimer DNA glycosylase/endonuclease V [Actinomycetaceae bacterium]|nr:pyrimidine dimer DNA glycosylase/endonuclease V [Actinomycetaceae bacterium]
MRLWSLHPKHLDRIALVALWRESLLAQKVLAGLTRGYRHHPQLQRFRQSPDPLQTIADYLWEIQNEASARGYRFDASKIGKPQSARTRIEVSDGQLRYELEHLRAKVSQRSPQELERLPKSESELQSHPLFEVVEGEIAPWEKQK